MPRLVKVFGERNTGTRVVQRYLRDWPGVAETPSGAHDALARQLANKATAAVGIPVSRQLVRIIKEGLADDLTLADGAVGAWKHAAAVYDPAFAEKDIRVLFLVKSPGAWLTSLYRRPHHRLSQSPDGFAAFARSPWICVRREQTPNVVANPLVLWNLKVRSYFKFAKRARRDGVGCLFIRFEDIVLSQVETVDRIAGWLELERPGGSGELEVDTKYKGRTLEEMKRYYRNEDWRGEMDEETARFIVEQVSSDLTERLGYGRA